MLNSLPNALLIQVALLCIKGHFVYGKSWHTFGPFVTDLRGKVMFFARVCHSIHGGGALPTRESVYWGSAY